MSKLKLAQPQTALRLPEYGPVSKRLEFGGVDIEITKDGNVTIKGAKNFSVEAEDFSIDAERISFHAKESLDVNVNGDIYLGSSTHMIMQAPRIDHNPKKDRKSGYKIADEIKKLIRTFANYYPSWRDPKHVYDSKTDEVRLMLPSDKLETHTCKCGKCDASKS